MNELGRVEASTLKKCIADWLSITQDLDFQAGLDARESDRRASELLDGIVQEQVSPTAVVVDDGFKHLLSILISRLTDDSSESPETCLVEADAVYKFIERLRWPEDPLGERKDLLLECAQIGWGAIGLSLTEVTRRRLADNFLEVPPSKAEPNSWRRIAKNPNSAPSKVAETAIAAHQLIDGGYFDGQFDEKQYLLGETALLAASALRILGRREETDKWLAKAEARIRHTVNPTPGLANIAYVRLALLYDRGRFKDVVELASSLSSTFGQLGMRREEAKTRLIKASALKVTGRLQEALRELEELLANPSIRKDAQLFAHVFIEIGDASQMDGKITEALEAFSEASDLLQSARLTATLGDLKLDIGGLLRAEGQLEGAVEAFREALRVFQSLEISTREAYAHVLVAETLLSMRRYREAECEILAALPTIEEQKMVPEGFAAVALLKESVRLRKADPSALRELREHLQKNN